MDDRSAPEDGGRPGAPWPAAAPRYLDQSAAALRLGLLSGEADLSRYRVLRSSRLTRPWIGVEACVIGASHLIRFAPSGGQAFSEVFAALDLGADASCFFSAGLRALRGDAVRPLGDGASHRFSAQIARGAPARQRLRVLATRIEAGGRSAGAEREIGLRYQFPHAPGFAGGVEASAAGAPPCTLVWLEVDDGAREVRVETAHSYPNEDRVVFSQTRLCVPDGRSERGC